MYSKILILDPICIGKCAQASHFIYKFLNIKNNGFEKNKNNINSENFQILIKSKPVSFYFLFLQ